MIEQAEKLGFAFSRVGCPCSGSPYVYTCVRKGRKYVLNIWQKRDTWKLTSGGVTLAYGNSGQLTTKIKGIWVL